MKINEVIVINLTIYLLRENKKMSDLHDITGISKSTLCGLKKSKGVQYKTIEKIAEALNIKPYQLFIERIENL